jgi:hypothetical protein
MKVGDGVNMDGMHAVTQERAGGLSRYHMGDKWEVRCMSDSADYLMTIEFVGEDSSSGRGFYVLRISFGPGAAGRPDNMVVHIDGATLFPMRIQTLCAHTGIPVTVVTAYDDQFPGATPYPLDPGKEFEVIQMETTTYSVDGEIPVETETMTSTLICKVEATEEITVPAGTFTCVRVTKYDQDGTAIGTSWKSDEVGHAVDVKYLDYQTDEVCELVSYPDSALDNDPPSLIC